VSRRTAERLGLGVLFVVLAIVLASATLVDRVPPSVDRIFLTRTGDSDTVAMTHAAIGVEFSEPVREPGAQVRFRLDPSVPGAFSWADDRTLIFTPSQKLPDSTSFSAHVEAGYQDLAGNAAKSSSKVFTFTTIGPPSVASTIPSQGATNVALDATVSVTFDRLMDTQRTAAAVTLLPSTPFQALWNGPTLTLTPAQPLLPDTSYRLVVGTGAADADGNNLAASSSITFQTIQVGLGIQEVLPADGSAGVPLDTPIGLVLAGPVDPSSVAGSLSITPSVGGSISVVTRPDDPAATVSPVPSPSGGGAPGGTSPSGAASPAAPTPAAASVGSTPSGGPAEGTVVLFQPSQALAPNTTYTVTLTAGVIRGLNSSQAAPGRTWTFTTGGPPEPLQNQVLFLAARSGVQNVWAMNADGTGAHQVTAELVPVTSFDVTGDGRSLAYSAGGVVRVMSLPSGQVTTVTDPASAEYAPILLPDGTGVIVGRRDRASGADEGWWLEPLAGGAGSARQLLPGGAPPLGSTEAYVPLPAQPPGPWTRLGDVSADGSRALLPRSDGSLAVVTLTTGQDGSPAAGTVFPTGLSGALGPAAWSVTSGRFVVVATRSSDGLAGTWQVGADGLVIPGPPLAAWSDVAQDGSIVGLSAVAPGHLAYAASPTALPQVLTTAADLLDREPSFGPSSDEIVFVRVAAASPGESGGIWTVGADGRDLRQLSIDGSDPRWLP
jgi:Bacterial Ig-like domain